MARYTQLIYVSAAERSWDPADLVTLLHVARARNAQRGITGLLGHNYGTFLQFLEGPHEAVQELLQLIRSDSRHGALTVLLERDSDERYFPDWSMGFQELDAVIPGPGLSTYLPQAGSPAMWAAQPEAALGFFELCRTPAAKA